MLLKRIFLLIGGASMCGSAFAQTATVSGQVTDPTGAVVPGARVTALNTQAGTKTVIATNGAGTYVIPFLQPGYYEISVEMQGFRPASRPGLKLDVDQAARVDFALQTGSVTESIDVTGTLPVLQTEAPSLGQQIENKTVVTLPLNGRDYTQLVTLSAGASPNHYSRASNGFSLNGGVTLQTTLLLDGTDNTNYEIGLDSANINAVNPSVDAIQEFKVETANYSAEYGRSANGIVSVSIKSGTNAFHGDAFEFLRNDALDANDFFANRAGLARAPLRRNQYGGTLGGPVVRNHSFFFGSYQGTRLTSSNTVAVTVPTGQMAAGAFGSTAIYDPLNVVNGVRQQFAGNVIPADRIDPVGRKLAALYPAPNVPGAVNNFSSNQATTNNADELDTRFDQQFTTRDTAFFRYSRGTSEKDSSSVFAPPGNGLPFPRNIPTSAWSMAAAETHIFSSAFVNEFHAGYSHNSSNQLSPAAEPLFSQFGFVGIPPSPQITGLPTIGMGSFSNLGNQTFTPNLKLVQVIQLNDTMSWNRGNHNVRFGFEIKDTHNFADSANMPRGNITFTGQFTSRTPGQGKGSELADLLLGQTATAGLGTYQLMHLRNHYYGMFVNDSWKVTPKLTLNLGLRYDLQTPWWERDNAQTNFDIDPSSATFGALVPARGGSYPNRTFVDVDTNNFAPRAGLAYRWGGKTVLRAAFGIFYGFPGYVGNNDSGTANPPYLVNVVVTSPTTAAASSVPLAAGFPPDLLNPVNLNNPNVFSIAKTYPMPVIDQWNFSVQRELGGGNSATVSYVGSSGSHLAGLNDINAPIPGPGALNPRRPFPAFGQVEYETPYAHSTYQALQASFERRFSKGLSVISNYTWSHSLDNVLNHEDNVGGAFPQNPRNTSAEKASSGYDIRQRFVASVIYELPLGRKSGLLVDSAVFRAVAGGWQTGAIFAAQTGYPITPTVSPNPANTTGASRPDQLCNANLPGNRRTVDDWFNVACFQPATPFLYGNSARDVIRAPGLVNLDFLAQRNFHFTESRYVEFRAEFFNLTNSVHLGPPNVAVGTAQEARITTTSSPSREIEFGLKVWF